MKKQFIDNELTGYYGDERIPQYLKFNKTGKFKCVYCGRDADSREHTPSKVFLDEPFDDELAILPACKQCNNSYSANEQYLACLIDFVQYKANKLDAPRRDKIRRTFDKRPSIKTDLEYSIKYAEDGNIEYSGFEHEKIKNAILKLAIGHAVYYLSGVYLGKPDIVNYWFILQLGNDELVHFNREPVCDVLPELGSRGAYVSIDDLNTAFVEWNVVQEEQYRFLAFHDEYCTTVKIVIGEYFYAEVKWDQ